MPLVEEDAPALLLALDQVLHLFRPIMASEVETNPMKMCLHFVLGLTHVDVDFDRRNTTRRTIGHPLSHLRAAWA